MGLSNAQKLVLLHRRGGGSAGGNDPLYTSLTAFWKMDEASGNRADSIGTATAVDTNTVGSNTGLVYALAGDFVRANSEMLAAADADAISVNGDIAWWVAVWFYPDAVNLGSMGIVGKLPQASPTANISEFTLYLENSTLNGLMGHAGGWTWTNPTRTGVTAAAWHLAVLWHDPAADAVYLQLDNGAVGSAATAGRVAPATAEALRIGSHAGTYFDGRIGPVMMGKGYVPDADNRTWLWNSGNGRTLAAMAAL